MRADYFDVVVVGTGAAGVGAAYEFAGQKCRVLFLDENGHTGGQLLRGYGLGKRAPGGKRERSGRPRKDKEKGLGRFAGLFTDPVKGRRKILADALGRPNITVMQGARVLGIYPERTVCIQAPRGGIFNLKPRFIILATGARERFLPFKGWTLPGVISLGGAQILMKESWILPGRRTVVAGAGPMVFSLGGAITRNGGEVAAVLDSTGPSAKKEFFRQWPPQFSRLKEGALDMATLLASGIPVRQRRMVLEARGEGRVEEVVTAGVDPSGRKVPGSEKTYSGDCLAVGRGFIPNLELPASAGAALTYRDDLGSWVVGVDEGLETSERGIFAAGETTGVGGGGKSLVEGRLAALSILRELGGGGASLEARRRSLVKKRAAELRFAAFLASLCRVPEAAFEELDNSVVVCRCEDITLGEIREMVAMGFHTPGQVKKACRSGMGNCQGRTCGPMIQEIVGRLTGEAPDIIPPLGARPPVKTVRLDALAAMAPIP